MTNLVAITVKATDSTDYAVIKANAAKAGAEAADSFNRAFKVRADASAKGSGGGTDEGLLGRDASILSRLKSYANTPGGIGLIGTGGDTSLVSMLKDQIRNAGQNGGLGLLGTSGGGGGTSSTDLIREVLANNVTGNVSTEDMIRQVLTGNTPGNLSTEDVIRQVLTGSSPGNVTTEDMVREVLSNNVTGNVSTEDFIKQVLEGNKPGNVDTTDTIHEKVDTSGVDGRKDGAAYGTDFLGAFAAVMKGGGGGEGGDGDGLMGAVSGALNSGGIAGGALPGIGGVSGMAATITGLVAGLAAVLPGLVSVGSGLGVIGAGFVLLDKSDKQFAADMKSDLGSIAGVAEQAAQGLAKPLESAVNQLTGYIKGIEPEMASVFSAAVPLIQPVVQGIENLVNAMGPGLLDMLKAGLPVMQQFAGGLGDLGSDLGTMFSDFAGAGASAGIATRAILDLLGDLLPLIGKIGEVMAQTMAPAFADLTTAIGQVFSALTPVLTIIGQFAGAVLTDLSGVLGSFGVFLKDLAPSFTALGKAAGSLFNTLENTGVFAELGDAIEQLAKPLSNLIDALVTALAPALPGIVSGLSKMAGAVTEGAVTVLSGAANALTAIVKAIPPGAMTAIVDGLTGAYVATKLWAGAMAVADALSDANPWVEFGIGVAAVASAFYLAYEKSALFRDALKDVAAVFVGVGIVVVETANVLTQAVLGFFGDIIDGAAKAFGWIPGIGGPLKDAAASFTNFRLSVNSDFNSAIATMSGWANELLNDENASQKATASITSDFGAQKQAADDASSSLGKYTAAIQDNGVNSSAAQAARAQLIKDLENAGVQADTAQADVGNYTAAVQQNGVKSQQAAAARQQLVTDILDASSNAKQGLTDLNNYTTAVKNNGTSSEAAKAARAQLIQDLVNSGVDAKTATNLVNGLTTSIGKIPKNTDVNIDVSGSGTGGVEITASGLSASGQGNVKFTSLAGGGVLPGYSPGQDSEWARLSPGEGVLVPEAVRALGPGWVEWVNSMYGKGRKSGAGMFAGGGIAGLSGGLSGAIGSAGGYDSTFGESMVANTVRAMLEYVKSQQAAAAATASAGPGGGDPAANAALAKKLYPKWATGIDWTDWNNVAMRESGWSQFANNASSGAYGIPQALPFTKMPKAAWPASAGGSSNPTAQIEWMAGYMLSTYGGPQGAWNSELTRGYYDNGGWLKPGYTLAYNGTGSPEPVGAGMGGGTIALEVSSSGQTDFDKFMLHWMRENVRIKGGGSVQKAFGIGSG